MVGQVHRLWISRLHPLAIVSGNRGRRDVRRRKVVTAIGGMRSRYARRQRQTGEGQVGSSGRRVQAVDGDICVAPTGPNAEIGLTSYVVGASEIGRASCRE